MRAAKAYELILFVILFTALSVFVSGCSTSQSIKDMKQEVEVGDDLESHMMQCRVLCNADKVYAFTDRGLKCQCKTPVVDSKTSPVMRFEVVNKTGQNNTTAARGVMTQLLNGKTVISAVPNGN